MNDYFSSSINQILKLDIKRQIIISWGLFIIFLSFLLFFYSQQFSISLIFFLINIIIALYQIINSKKITLYSPFFQLIVSIVYYYTIPALYYFSSFNTIFNRSYLLENDFYIQVSILYLIFILSLIFPYLVFKLFNIDIKIDLSIIKKNYNIDTCISFYYISFIICFLLLCFLFLTTGFSPMEAIKNPLAFRLIYARDFYAYISKPLLIILNINIIMILKNLIVDKINSKNFKFICFLQFSFLIVFAFMSGARGLFLYPALTAIFIYAIFRKITIKKLLYVSFYFILLIQFLSFYHLYRDFMSSISKGGTISKTQSSSFIDKTAEINVLNSTLSRIDAFANSCDFFEYIYKEHGSILYFSNFNIKNQIIAQFTNPVPRSLLPNKSYIFTGEMTKRIKPNHFKHKIILLYSGISNAFWNIGLAGIILEGLLFGTLIAFFEKNFHSLIKYDFVFLIYLSILVWIPGFYTESGFLNTDYVFSRLIVNIITISLLTLILTKKIKLKVT